MKTITRKSIVSDGKPLTFTQLKKFQKAEVLKVKTVSLTALNKLVRDFTGDPSVNLSKTPVTELTPRHPYDAMGLMDVYKPGRWDCTYNLLYMDTIVTGNSPGVWDGTVAYLNFKASQSGTYLIVCNFSGYQITMRLNGPWGNNTAYTPTPADTGTAIAMWNGSANQNLAFTLNCITRNNGYSLGYLSSVQIFLL